MFYNNSALFRTAPFKFINGKIKQIILDEFEKMKTSIQWNELGSAKSILEAEKEVGDTGRDIGWQQIESFISRDDKTIY